MALSTLALALTAFEGLILILHFCLFGFILKKMYEKAAPFTSAFFKLYLLRCLADYVAYATVSAVVEQDLGILFWAVV